MAKELTFHANFRDGSLYLGCKRGILRIDSVPMVRASKFDLKSRQGPVWQECFPRLRLDRLFRMIDGWACRMTGILGRAPQDAFSVIGLRRTHGRRRRRAWSF